MMKSGQIETEQVEKLLKPRVSRLSVFLKLMILTYSLAQVASVVLLSLNIFAYRDNMLMQSIFGCLIGISLFFLVFEGRMLESFRRLDRRTTDLYGLLKERITFFRHRFERFNLVTAVTLWILTFSLNTYVDNQNGSFRINRPLFFIAISLGMMAFIYFINKFSAEAMLKETRACLNELEKDWDGSSEAIDRIRKRQKIFNLVAVLILTVLMLIGLLVFLSQGKGA